MRRAEVSDQMEQEVSRKSLLRRAALLVGVGSIGALAAPAVAGATTKTGQYTGNGTTTQVATGLAAIRALRIVNVPAHGPSIEAFTTNTIQSANGTGTVLVNGRRDTGVALEAGNFTVTHPDLNESAVVYHWTADGD
jgi:hypothetical protein